MAAERGSARASGGLGAYGLRLANVERARPFLARARVSWPRLEIKRTRGESSAAREWLTETEACLKLQSGGEIRVDRERGRATYVLSRPVGTAELVHPLLAPVGAVMSFWLGRECFHAGGFVVGGRTWGIIGGRGSGKSTTVAQLALAGIPIVGDDLLVVRGRTVFAGPRAVDLRRDAARRLGVGEGLGVVGTRERWRVRLSAVGAETTLAGWIFLAWGDRVETVSVPGSDRLVRLHTGRGINLPPRRPEVLLDLAALPAWELRRPKGWRSAHDALDCLLETVG